jgi:hypothetical protein
MISKISTPILYDSQSWLEDDDNDRYDIAKAPDLKKYKVCWCACPTIWTHGAVSLSLLAALNT